MLIVRTGGERSGRSSARLSNWKFALDESCTPPPGTSPVTRQRRQTRDRAHGHSAAGVSLQTVVDANERGLRAAVPFAERDDRLGGNAGDRADALRRVLASTLAQLLDADRVLRRCSRRPRVRARTARASCRARAPRRCRGESPIHSSHCAAVRVRIGSIAMIVAPRSRASSTNGHRCGFAVSVFVPQSRTRSLSGMPSGSAPMFAPTVIRMPIVPGDRADRAVEQRRADEMEESPIHRRALDHAPSCRRTSTAGSPAARRSTRESRSAASRSRRALRPTRCARTVRYPSGPTRRIGYSSRSRMIRPLDVPVHLRAEKPARERMVGIAGDAHRAADPRRSRASRTCPDSRADRRRERLDSLVGATAVCRSRHRS